PALATPVDAPGSQPRSAPTRVAAIAKRSRQSWAATSPALPQVVLYPSDRHHRRVLLARGSDTLGCAALWRWGQTQWAATVVVSAASAREPSCVLPACAGSRLGHAGPSAKPAGARTCTRRAAREPPARPPF